MAAVSVVALAACGGEAAEQTAPEPAPTASEPGAASPPSPDGTGPDDTTPAGGTAFVGTLEGDAQLEGGCLWLAADGERYELRLPPGYEVDVQELAIVPPSGDVITTGTELRVVGETQDDMVTICQVGPVIDVSSLTRTS